MNINNLFPTPVAFFKFGRDLTETELEFIKGQEHYANEGNTTSKDRKILKNKELTELRDFIEDSMLEYFKAIHAPKFDVSLLFPSHLTHMVQTKEDDNTRISIAFNTFLKGYIGSDESLTGLHLGEE